MPHRPHLTASATRGTRRRGLQKVARLFLGSVVLATAIPLVPAPAFAQGLVINSPTHGAIYSLGQSITISLSVSAPESRYYDVWADNVSAGVEDGHWQWDTDQSKTFTRTFTPSARGQYVIWVEDEESLDYAELRFEVVAPLFKFIRTRPTDSNFYPTVRDGYRDYIDIEWRVTRKVTTRGYIKNSNGRTVLRISRSVDRPNRVIYFRWRGKNTAGNVVQPGRFRFVIEETSARRESASLRFKVSTGWRTKKFVTARTGTRTSSRVTNGNCFISGYDGVLKLDCWGGAYALAKYRIRIPSNAFQVTRSIRTSSSSADICCHGKISKGWRGNVARVRVTGWRAVEVVRVRVSYKRRIRI